MRRIMTFLVPLGLGALAIFGLFGAGGVPPAGAVGLATLCDDGELTIDPIPRNLLFSGDAIGGQQVVLQNFPQPGLVGPDPDGSPAFTPAALHSVHLDADGLPDLQFGLGVRTSTAAAAAGSATGPTPLHPLFAENFGITPGSGPWGSGVEVLGLDLLVQLPEKSWIRQAPTDGRYAAEIALRLARLDPANNNAVVDHLDLAFSIDALQAAARDPKARFPDEVRISLAPKPTVDDIVYWSVGQEVVYAGITPDDYPALDVGVSLTQLAPGRNDDDPPLQTGLLDVGMAWDRVPEDFAVGVAQTCQTTPGPGAYAHFASQLPTPARAGHALDLTVRSGLRGGLDGADEVRVEGRVEGVPRQLGVVQQPDRFDVVHSSEVAPTIALDRLDLALDDQARSDDQPLHGSGRLEGLPAQVRVDLDRDAAADISGVDLDACPRMDPTDELGEFAPAVAPSLQQSGFVPGCDPTTTDPAALRVRNARLVVQNFLPDGRYAGAASDNLPAAPPARRQAGTDCRYERVPDRPWRLVCDPVAEVPRTAFVLAAAQHPHYSPGVDGEVLLVRAGADLVELAGARVDLSEASRRLPEEPGAGPDEMVTYGARTTTQISLDAGAEPLAQLIGHLDRRTDIRFPDENRGVRASVRGTMVPFPGSIDWLKITSLTAGTEHNVGDEVPLDLRWQLPEAVTLNAEEVEVQLPGRNDGGDDPPALMIDGQAALALPAQARLRVAAQSAGSTVRTTVEYQPNQVFGTRDGWLSVAARVTTDADRRAGQALTLSGTTAVDDAVTVALTRNLADGALDELDVDACPAPTGCENTVELDAVVGPDPGVPSLATGVTPPAPAPPRPWVTPPAPEANHVGVVLDPASGQRWGASVVAENVVGLLYRPGPGDLCVSTASTKPLTAAVQGPGWWVHGRLDHLPTHTRVRFTPDPAASGDEPMLWVDTTSCTTEAPPVAETVPNQGPGDDEAAGRPVLEAMAVLGSGTTLDAIAGAPALPAGGIDGIAVTAQQDADGSVAGVVALRAWLRDHLLVWAPTTSCADGGSSCESPGWQAEDDTGIRMRVQSTRPDLGALTLAATLAGAPSPCRATPSNQAIQGSVPQLPGSFDVRAGIRSYGRLCWTDLEVDVAASTALGSLDASVTDLTQHPTDLSLRTTGFKGDAVGSARTAVPEMAVALSDIGRELHVTARQRGDEETPDTYPQAPSDPPCRGQSMTPRGSPTIGYLDLALDLSADGSGSSPPGAPATDVVVDMVQARTDPRGTDDATTLATMGSDAPIDATVQTRLNNVTQYVTFSRPDPIPRGLGVLLAPLAEAFLPGLGGALSLAVDPAIEDAAIEACVDLDMPLTVIGTNVTTVRLAQSGASFALDTDTGAGASALLDVGEYSTDGTTFRSGIPYAYRSIDFDTPLGGIRTGVVTNTWKSVVALARAPVSGSIGACGAGLPYAPGILRPGTATVPTGTVTGERTDRDGTVTNPTLNRASFVVDLLWDAGDRAQLAAIDTTGLPLCPGIILYQAMADLGRPPVTLPVGFLQPSEVKEASYTITQADAQAIGADFCSLSGWNTTDGGLPVAVGADGTRYTLEVWTEDPNRTYCRINLVARHPSGGLRWTRRIAENAAPLGFRAMEWRMRILPDADDGSVELIVEHDDQRLGTAPTLEKVWVARLDASGHGQILLGEWPDLSPVTDLLDADGRLVVPVVEPGDRCTGRWLDAGAPAGPDTTRVWSLGDGTRVVDQAQLVEHCYRSGGHFYAQYVDFLHIPISNGRIHTVVSGGGRWEVVVE